jgi:hypothetical protein
VSIVILLCLGELEAYAKYWSRLSDVVLYIFILSIFVCISLYSSMIEDPLHHLQCSTCYALECDPYIQYFKTLSAYVVFRSFVGHESLARCCF